MRRYSLCAADAVSFEPRLVVEAETQEQAARRLRHAVEWFGFGSWEGLVVMRFRGRGAGLPTFLAAYFESIEDKEPYVLGFTKNKVKH